MLEIVADVAPGVPAGALGQAFQQQGNDRQGDVRVDAPRHAMVHRAQPQFALQLTPNYSRLIKANPDHVLRALVAWRVVPCSVRRTGDAPGGGEHIVDSAVRNSASHGTERHAWRTIENGASEGAPFVFSGLCRESTWKYYSQR